MDDLASLDCPESAGLVTPELHQSGLATDRLVSGQVALDLLDPVFLFDVLAIDELRLADQSDLPAVELISDF